MTTAEVPPEAAVEITVDGVAMPAVPGEMLIAACERGGVYIPRFCYHPRMTPVGMCRMCLVEVDTGRGPSLQPSCMVPAAQGMKVLTESDAAKKAQDGVLEFLLINHPLDCPICDKGGECPLQDQTMAYGPGESRFVEEKRHFAKPIAISETVYLDRERCILCDRCTRFADEVAGDALIHFMGRGNLTEVNTYAGEPFASYFSGNTVQICPVGALTAKPYRFKARPWDLTETISTAWVDSLGSRIAVQASRNRVLRVLGVDADAVNWGWLSDKERFGFEALNSTQRLVAPLICEAGSVGSAGSVEAGGGEGLQRRDAGDRGVDGFAEAGWGEALGRVAEALSAAAPERVAVLGGARLTNEAQYMWAKLAKGVIGSDNVDAQLGDGLDPRVVLGLPPATIDDACRPAGTVLLLGPDPKEELGTLYLRLRHAIVNDGVTLIEVTPCATGLSSLAAHTLRVPPGTTAATVESLVALAAGGTVASEPAAPAQAGGDVSGLAPAAQALAASQGGVTVILGRASLAEAASGVEAAALELARLPGTRFLPVLRRGNVNGALRAGLAPGLLPGGVWLQDSDAGCAGALERCWPARPAAVGLGAAGILKAAAAGEIDVLVLLGADPVNDFIDGDLARRGLLGAATVVAVDLFVNDSAALAAEKMAAAAGPTGGDETLDGRAAGAAVIVLAAAGPTEVDGTFTNVEGRVSRLSRKVTPPGTARADWMIAAELAERLAPGSGSDTPEAIRSELAEVSEMHGRMTEQALAANPTEGVLLPTAGTGILPAAQHGTRTGPVPSEAAPASAGALEDHNQTGSVAPPDSRGGSPESAPPGGGYRLVATRRMYDRGVMLRHCPSIRGLAEPTRARLHPAELSRAGLAEGTDVRVTAGAGHLDVVLAADIGVPEGCLAVDWIAPGAPANTLITAGEAVTRVSVQAR